MYLARLRLFLVCFFTIDLLSYYIRIIIGIRYLYHFNSFSAMQTTQTTSPDETYNRLITISDKNRYVYRHNFSPDGESATALSEKRGTLRGGRVMEGRGVCFTALFIPLVIVFSPDWSPPPDNVEQNDIHYCDGRFREPYYMNIQIGIHIYRNVLELS